LCVDKDEYWLFHNATMVEALLTSAIHMYLVQICWYAGYGLNLSNSQICARVRSFMYDQASCSHACERDENIVIFPMLRAKSTTFFSI